METHFLHRLHVRHSPNQGERRLLHLKGGKEFGEALESADIATGKTAPAAVSIENEAETLAAGAMRKAKGTWLNAVNHFHLTKSGHRQEKLREYFLAKADAKIRAETTAGISRIWGWVRWGKRAEFLTLKYRMAGQMLQDARTHMESRNKELEQLVFMRGVSQRLRANKGSISLSSPAQKKLFAAMDSAAKELELAAKSKAPIAPQYTKALQTESDLKGMLKQLKVADASELQDLFTRHENGGNDLVQRIKLADLDLPQGVGTSAVRSVMLQMARELYAARGYSKYKLAEQNIDSLPAADRLGWLLRNPHGNATVTLSLPGRPPLKAAVDRVHPQYPDSLILSAKQAGASGKTETLILDVPTKTVGYRDPAGGVKTFALTDNLFSVKR